MVAEKLQLLANIWCWGRAVLLGGLMKAVYNTSVSWSLMSALEPDCISQGCVMLSMEFYICNMMMPLGGMTLRMNIFMRIFSYIGSDHGI